MKRTADEQTSQAQRNSYKRAKSIQACSNCRKHKVRCDPPSREDGSSSSRKCHRCKVLDLQCSFRESDRLPPSATKQPPPSTSTFASASTLNTRIPTSNTTARPTAAPTQQLSSLPPVAFARALTPESLMPKPEEPWGSAADGSVFDWTAMPLLAISEMTRPKALPLRAPAPVVSDVSIESVLTDEQITYLLDIFQTQYSPWLHLPVAHDMSRSPFLDLVKCMVASRHLDHSMRASVVPRLEKLSEDAYLQQIFNAVPSEESIQALLIFSLWAPVGDFKRQDNRDNRLLAASTVSVAENLSLSQTYAFVRHLKAEADALGGTLPPEKKQALHQAKDKARLWAAISGAEALLCLGTERKPTSATLNTRSPDGARYTPPVTSLEMARLTRLLQMTRLLELTHDGTNIRLEGAQGFDAFFQEAFCVLAGLTGLHRRLLPLPLISAYESFSFHIMIVYSHCCRLLVLLHLTRELRRVFHHQDSDTPWYNLRHNGIAFGMEWFREATMSAEAVCTQLLSRPDPFALATAPDHLFTLITFSAVILLWGKTSVLTSHHHVLSGYSDTTLTMIVDLLRKIETARPHAELIAECQRIYSDRLKAQKGSEAEFRQHEKKRISPLQPLNGAYYGTEEEVDERQGVWPRFTGTEMDLNLDGMVNACSGDSDFWPTFLNNLTTHTDVLPG